MPDTRSVTLPANLGNLGNVVPDGYNYYEKQIRQGEGLSLPNAYLNGSNQAQGKA